MHFIVYDLEATCWEGNQTSLTPETIEIGALKINRYGEVLSTFSRLIRPKLHPILSHFCRRLTTIDQVELNRAASFPEVIENFQEWCGLFNGDDFLLCSWGSFDKRQLISDCQLHGLETDWLEAHLNLRQQYHHLKKLHTYRSLKRVVEDEGYEFTGTYHRGLSDAQNLAKVFVKYIDMWQF